MPHYEKTLHPKLDKVICPGRCGVVQGSADGLFPPGISKTSDIIAIFSTDLCRWPFINDGKFPTFSLF